MECISVREALSARLDGEASPLSLELVESHCETCPDCAGWQREAGELHRKMRVAPAPHVPNLTADITTALAAMPLPAAAAQRALRACRVLLACCAGLQLIATMPMLFGPIHLDHELGSWDFALSTGLLFAAWRPARAWGMLPLVGALTLALGTTAVIDVARGHTSVGAESSHLMEAVGLLFLWNVARLTRHEQHTENELQLA